MMVMVAMVISMQGDKAEIRQAMEMMTTITLFSVHRELSQIKEREQILCAMKDEDGSKLNNEENGFMLDTSFDDETIEELTAAVMLMARIQPTDGNAKTVPSYDAKADSEVNASSKVHEQLSRDKRKTVIQTSDDDQINSNIIFDDSYVDNNGGTFNHDSSDHDKYQEIQMLAYNKVDEKSSKENILKNEIDRLLEVSLTSYIQHCVLISVEKQENELLQAKLEKSSIDSKDIQLSTLNDENVLLKTQVDSVVQERENIKLEFQKLFNSIKATRSQHQKEVDELIENVNQKTYAYADVRAQNQDLLMIIFVLINKLRTIEKGKNVNTKFDKSDTLGKFVCVTLFNKTLANKAKNVSNTKVPSDRSKPVTSQSTPKTEQSGKKMRIQLQEECVESSNSVRRPKSKNTKSKNSIDPF
ncbi:hypothetical protein Tco_1203206 [Tanacetum coccineum]